MNLLITAGPTREPIDAVRFISNRSSGRTGLAIAGAAAAAGHRVTLLYGPGIDRRDLPPGCRAEPFVTTDDLRRLLEAHAPAQDAFVLAAAVGDYRPAAPHPGKLPRQAGGLTLALEPTPDLAAWLAAYKRPGQRVIAFALEEPANLESRAMDKLRRKAADAIVANPLDTLDATTIDPVWLTAGGGRDAPGPMPKTDFARWLATHVERLVGSGVSGRPA